MVHLVVPAARAVLVEVSFVVVGRIPHGGLVVVVAAAALVVLGAADEPPGEPTDVVSRLERLRALRDSGSLSAAEFEELKQQVLREPGSFAAQAPVLLAPPAPPPPRRLSPPPPDADILPAMAMPPRAVPRPPAYEPPYAAVPRPPRGYGEPPPPLHGVLDLRRSALCP